MKFKDRFFKERKKTDNDEGLRKLFFHPFCPSEKGVQVKSINANEITAEKIDPDALR